jgi:O-6-methylguanine DNA methyltransferase
MAKTLLYRHFTNPRNQIMLLKENIRFQTEIRGGSAVPVQYGSCATPFGETTLFWDRQHALCGLYQGDPHQAIEMAHNEWGLVPQGKSDPATASQIFNAILSDSAHEAITLRMKGTPFQISVWKALMDVPFADTWTYQQLARHVGNEKAARAVGTAVGKNPLPIVIPCHRIVRGDGSIGNYNGGIERKQKILDWEKVNKQQTVLQ